MSLILRLTILTWSVMTGGLRAAEAQRPNIIIILSDDMGFSDLGCYGSEIATPNLDRLAAGGLRFTQFYNTARCCPTRAALLTGLYSHQAGVGHMTDDHQVPGYQGHLNDRCVTIAEALRPAGYRTLMSGKWHVGDKPNLPVERGFDESFCGVWGAWNYFRWSKEIFYRNDQRVPEQEQESYLTDVFTDNAIRSIETGDRSKPFFLYLAYSAAHWPLHALPDDIARYKGKYMDGWEALRERRYRRMIELGTIKPQWKLSPPDPQEPAWDSLSPEKKDLFDLKMAVYAAQIDRMDQNIGRLLAKLRELGVEENTLVLFLQDNGGCAEEVNRGAKGAPPGVADSFLSYGLPWAHASNTPFRLYKHWVHEGGISTPLIANWPAVIKKKGALTEQPGHLIDLMATCLDVAKAGYPREFNGHAVTPLEGKSLLPIFEGKTREEHEAIFWEHEGNRAVRQGKWKLVSRFPGGWELYDLEADRTELHDTAIEHPDKVKELSALYDGWAGKVGALPWRELRSKESAANAKKQIAK